MASGRPLTGLVWSRFPAQDRVLALALQVGVDPPRGGHLIEAADRQAVGLVVELLRLLFGLLHDLLDRRRESVQGRFALRDRKSTRLNSSHSQISYAVFCLK